MIVVISEPSSGKSFQTEVPKGKESGLLGKKIGDELDGGLVGAAGYTFTVRGGSDTSGFPMRSDVSGPRRTGVLLASGPGYISTAHGARRKRSVRGNLVSDEIQQINCVVKKAGTKPLAELFPGQAKKEKEKR